MTDPKYPRRPTSPDFWLISQGLIDEDKQSEQTKTWKDFTDLIDRYVDYKSLSYAAEQRAHISINSDPKLIYPAREVAIKIAAAWMDAFIQGVRFQQLKQNPPTTEDTP